jgi:hypothetical protein
MVGPTAFNMVQGLAQLGLLQRGGALERQARRRGPEPPGFGLLFIAGLVSRPVLSGLRRTLRPH